MYAHAGCSLLDLQESEFQIFIQEISGRQGRIFLVPSSVILSGRFYFSETGYVCIFLPIEKLPIYKNRKPRIDWWQYENAWHLIKNKDESSAAM